MHPPLLLVGASTVMERGCQQNDRTLVNGCRQEQAAGAVGPGTARSGPDTRDQAGANAGRDGGNHDLPSAGVRRRCRAATQHTHHAHATAPHRTTSQHAEVAEGANHCATPMAYSSCTTHGDSRPVVAVSELNAAALRPGRAAARGGGGRGGPAAAPAGPGDEHGPVSAPVGRCNLRARVCVCVCVCVVV